MTQEQEEQAEFDYMNDVEARQRRMIEKHQKALQKAESRFEETNSVDDDEDKQKVGSTFVIKTPETEPAHPKLPVQTISQSQPKQLNVDVTANIVKNEKLKQVEFLKSTDPF